MLLTEQLFLTNRCPQAICDASSKCFCFSLNKISNECFLKEKSFLNLESDLLHPDNWLPGVQVEKDNNYYSVCANSEKEKKLISKLLNFTRI